MDFIDKFLAQYAKEFDFYERVGSIVQQRLDAQLRSAGVRAIVTARAKSMGSLEDKCRKRGGDRGGYKSVDEIYGDIADLAGVRVALYFPGEIGKADSAIAELFDVIKRKEFPDKDKARPGQPRFSGYKALHYRIQLKGEDLNEAEKRYAAARIEVQVASVLMHAWSEVEHDLVYKPLAGDLSEEEYALLDQVNGLVMSGEIALERLQKAAEIRVAVSNRKISNHYDLAALLASAGEGLTDGPINDSGMGRVDQLFDLIHELGIDTPALLKPYIDALHGNVEVRPLAEQIIDALLAEDPKRYEIYTSIRAHHFQTPLRTDSNQELYMHIGRFMSTWRDLEALVRQATELQSGRSPVLPTGRQLVTLELLSPGMVNGFEQLRRMRNLLVHGVELPELADLDDATNRLAEILTEMKRQFGNRQNSGLRQASEA
jgi:ppGpp synthetase/RelA/SpoT-type nucleotidyltranferase